MDNSQLVSLTSWICLATSLALIVSLSLNFYERYRHRQQMEHIDHAVKAWVDTAHAWQRIALRLMDNDQLKTVLEHMNAHDAPTDPETALPTTPSAD